eukprot:1459491-Heterocapsa_arctica.AAC.1
MFPERWLAGNYRHTRRSRLNSHRTSTAEGCWPRKHRLELPGATSWNVVGRSISWDRVVTRREQ